MRGVVFLLFILLVLTVVIILITAVKLNIAVSNNSFDLEMVFLGFIKLHRRYVIRRKKGEIFTLYRRVKNKEKKVISLYDIIRGQEKKPMTEKQKMARKKLLRFLYKKTRIKITAKVRFGLPDAASTAICCGMLGAVSAAADAVTRDKHHQLLIQITPVFAKQVFSIHAKGIMALSPANIILGYILYKKSLRR